MRRFVTFEGSEGCGKTTQLRLAAAWLEAQGLPVLATAEPGGTPLGLRIRDLLLNRGPVAIGAEAELFLFAAARAQHVREAIGPALEAGRWVLCDRFGDATLAYQGFGRGLDLEVIRRLNALCTLSLEPERTLLLDLPPETGLARARQRAAGVPAAQAEDRFEQEALAFHRRVREGYLRLAAEAPGRFVVIDGTGDVETVQQAVRRALAALL